MLGALQVKAGFYQMKRFTKSRLLITATVALSIPQYGLLTPLMAVDTPLKPKPGLPAFEYMEAPGPLPNYVPGAKWGTQAAPIRTMQKPLSPEESAKHFVTHSDFDIQLFAAEPQIAKAICMAWDARGRMWIAETFDYPNDMQPEGQGHDRIVICEDTDGDGKADKFTVFADKLSVPTGMIFSDGGLIVVHSGKMEFFKDTDGDDKADLRKVLIDGWGTRDTHAGPSNLRYGFDGWIWGVVGYSGFKGTVGGKEITFGQGIYRFKSDGSQLEFVRSSNNNTWGLGFSEEGIVFGSTANNNASMYMPIPNRYYEAVQGWSAARIESIADSQSYYPITEKVRQVDWHNKYTAGAGGALYTARSFPQDFWNKVQFVAEPTGHLLGQFRLEANGDDFVSHNEHNFLASDDEWSAPIAAEVGPDGSLWVIDWYNYIIQHNPVPNGFTNGKGNAYETPLRDKTHGRLYKVTYRPGKKNEMLNLEKASPDQLVAALKNENMLWRLHAQRLLTEQKATSTESALCDLAADKSVDALGLNTAAIHALWTLNNLGLTGNPSVKVKSTLEAALRHPSAGVRRAAVGVLPRSTESAQLLLKNNLLTDENSQVRLATLLTLSEVPPSTEIGAALEKNLHQWNTGKSHWLNDAITAAAAKNSGAFLSAVLKSSDPISPSTETAMALRTIATHHAASKPADVLQLLAGFDKKPAPLVGAILDGIIAGWPDNSGLQLSDSSKKEFVALLDKIPAASTDKLFVLARKWDQQALLGDRIQKMAEELKAQVRNTGSSQQQRIDAAGKLVRLDPDVSSVESVLSNVSLTSAPGLASGLISSLAESKDPRIGTLLVTKWSQLSPAMRRAAITVMLRRSPWANSLLDAIEKGTLSRTDLAAEYWTQLKANPDRALSARATTLSVAVGTVSADSQDIIKKMLPLASEKGDAVHGKEIFTANCAVCHTFNAQGGKVGPDLTGIAVRDRKDILIDILDPNRSVEANYRLWSVNMKDGESFSGRLETETQTSVEILDTAGQKHILQRGNITELKESQLSIMPNGFEALPANDLKALLEYLTSQPH
ncbi:MAG: putative rane-bound dehydrogenase [Verrucomicrobiales bacterium]|nr:putative rane-bound dehydrogenase [Verrucomicrobiales bacterium]